MIVAKERHDPSPIERLEKWLALKPVIPRFHHRANKTAICRLVKIARSTADANPKIRALIAELDQSALSSKPSVPIAAPMPTSNALENSALPCGERNQPADSNCYTPAFKYLLRTGRIVR